MLALYLEWAGSLPFEVRGLLWIVCGLLVYLYAAIWASGDDTPDQPLY